MPEPIYLDNAATTPVLPEVADAVRDAMLSLGGNASSQHAAGRAARRLLEDSRERIVELLGGRTGGRRPDRLLLTSGATEANNHALRGAMPAGGAGAGSAGLVVSSVEHPSVAATARRLEAQGVRVDRLPAGATGVTNLDPLGGWLAGGARLVSLVLGASETGVVQPVGEAVALADAAADGPAVPVHTDATQAVGKRPVDFTKLGVAMLTFAAHKFHGPAGVGGLLVRGDCQPTPLLAGQADAERPGAPPVALVVGMRRALEIALADLPQQAERLASLRDRLESRVLAEVAGATVLGADAERLPHIASIAFAGRDRQALMMALDREGVACSTGSACASGSSEPSPVLIAMGLPEEQVRGAIRFSLGRWVTAAEIDRAAGLISGVCKRLNR